MLMSLDRCCLPVSSPARGRSDFVDPLYNVEFSPDRVMPECNGRGRRNADKA
jgi:hypothetical protein